jgi:pimeloyl-ACP methyl ester carboxylesterase
MTFNISLWNNAMTPVNQHAHTLHTRASGPIDAPTIVFLHGGGSAGWMWEPVVAYLPDYHCLMPDLPEHGGSQAVKPFSMEYAATLTAQLIRTQTHGGRAHVMGLSEGAQTLVALLASAPEVVASAVISSALLRPIPGGSLMTPGVLAATYYSAVAPFKRSETWIRLNMKHSAGVPGQYFEQFKQDFQALTKEGWVNLMRANQRFRLPSGLERATAPALVVVGSKEYAAMKESARDLVAALPNARGYTVSLGQGASLAQEHNWALNAPEIFAATVRAWIEGQPLPGALQPLV